MRANQRCTIVGNADEVHCRSGPGTSYSSKVTLPKGSRYLFSCVKTGECVTINGAKNWLDSYQLEKTNRDQKDED